MLHRWMMLLGLSLSWVCAACVQHRVLPGIDVLLADSAHLIAGKRIGLITNATGVDAAGVSTVDRLRLHAGTRLVALFAPEHHLTATLRPGELFGDTVDAATGLPIYSLYRTNRAPTPAQLELVDVIVADLQDVGARPFTYISTIVESMRATGAAGKRFIVLDRPNPIGCPIQGPVLDLARRSFIGLLPVPLRHGLTMGELARFANDTLGIHVDLVVVPVTGWRRCDWFDATGLPWVRPSPNLPDLAALAWYPGTVLFESTNLSVGRGTDAPFTQIGAPWLDPAPVLALLAERGIPATRATFTPRVPGDGKFDGVTVNGIRLGPLDRNFGDVVASAILVLEAIQRTHPAQLIIDSAGMALRLGVPLQSLLHIAPGDTVRRWPGNEAFNRRIQTYRMYM